MANLIIKSSADNLVLQGSGGNSAITVAAAGTTTFAQNATLSGTANALGGITNTGTTWPSGHIIKTTFIPYGTRATVGTTASKTAINVLWNNTINKLLSTTDLLLIYAIAAAAGSSGFATWHIRENSSSWIATAGHQYIGSYGMQIPMNGKIPAADTSAGNNSIDLGWSTSPGGKPFNYWNPNSTDETNQLHYATQSTLIAMEVVV